MHPAVRDNLHAILLSTRGTVIYLMIVIAAGTATALTLPSMDLFRSSYIAGRPITFTATVTIALFMTAVAALLFAHVKMGDDSPLRLEYWIAYLPLSPGRLWRGEVLFALLHSLLIAALALPACTLAAGISGIAPHGLIAALLLLFLNGLLIRLLGLVVAAIPRASSLHAFFLLWLPVIFTLLILPGLYPALHPLGVLSALLPGAEILPPALEADSVIPYLTAGAAALLLLAFLLLTLMALGHHTSRRRAPGRGGPGEALP